MLDTAGGANLPLTDIDLEPIMVKAMDAEEGYGWTFEFTRRIADEYRRYLHLCQLYPEKPLVPSCYVDDLWHLHILDTIKYADDCNRVFGYFLHHFPYFGMRGEEDEKNLSDAWDESLALYAGVFGHPAPEDLWPKSQRCPNCGQRCKGGVESEVFADIRPRLADLRLQ
ncbi:MAG: hypothetical protein GDA53_01980 [Rhodobacteraceae bacterium]|nr:hypothetical protein [Paracoccaceae bacterium]